MRSTTISGLELKRRSSLVGVLLLAVLSTPGSGDVVLRHFEFETPRDFGYFVGDVIRQRAHLELSEPYELDSSLLPEVGRHDLWLELDPPLVRGHRERDGLRYEIDFVYRVVNEPEEAIRVTIPSISLVAQGDGRRVTKDTPSWTFTLSPLVMTGAGGKVAGSRIRPDHTPLPIALRPRQFGLALTLAALVIAAAYLCHNRWGLPGSSRRRRPFARACRDLRGLSRRSADETLYAELLRRFHQAVNEAAGKAVFAGDLECLFARQPGLLRLRPRIEALYERSAAVFFQEGRAPAPQEDDIRALMRLALDCRRAER